MRLGRSQTRAEAVACAKRPQGCIALKLFAGCGNLSKTLYGEGEAILTWDTIYGHDTHH